MDGQLAEQRPQIVSPFATVIDRNNMVGRFTSTRILHSQKIQHRLPETTVMHPNRINGISAASCAISVAGAAEALHKVRVVIPAALDQELIRCVRNG